MIDMKDAVEEILTFVKSREKPDVAHRYLEAVLRELLGEAYEAGYQSAVDDMEGE